MQPIIFVLTLTSVIFLSGLNTAPVQNSLNQNRTADGIVLEYIDYLADPTTDQESTWNEEKSGKFGSADDISDSNNYNVSSRVKRSDNVPRCGLPVDYVKRNNGSLTYYIANYPSSPCVKPRTVQRLIRRAFNAWSKRTYLNFREVYELPADINIAFGYSQHKNRKSTCAKPFIGNVVAHVFARSGEIHFNQKYFFDSQMSIVGYGPDGLFTTALHEIGHILGLCHSNSTGSVMYEKRVKNFYKLPRIDHKAIQSIYGKRCAVIPNRRRPPTYSSTQSPTRSPISSPTCISICLPTCGPPSSPSDNLISDLWAVIDRIGANMNMKIKQLLF